MMRWLMLFLLCSSFAFAETVSVLDIAYEDGTYTLEAEHTMQGYYPDRLLQPEGETFRIITDEGVVYQFRFTPPLLEFTDGDNGTSLGQTYGYDAANFSVIVPTYDNARYEIVTQEQEVFELVVRDTPWVGLVGLLLLCFVAMGMGRKQKRSIKTL